MSCIQAFTSSRRSTPSDIKARNPNSGCFVLSDVYRIAVPRLYSTLHTHPRSHRLWSVFPTHDVLSGRVAVSQGDTMQHPAYRLRRIPLLSTRVNKGWKAART